VRRHQLPALYQARSKIEAENTRAAAGYPTTRELEGTAARRNARSLSFANAGWPAGRG